MDEGLARSGPPTRLHSGLPSVAGAPRDDQPIWIHLPLAEAERLSPSLDMPAYCEALRCQSRQRTATTVHALITGHGEANLIWVACAECTRLMVEGAHGT
jgi:hypothetical protein